MNRDSRVVEIEIGKIVPNRFQPRKIFDGDISELAESIRAHGVLQPITVRPLGEKYEIVMGERRYRACEKLGMHKIPCIVVEMNDREAMEVALIENLQRQDLSPIEEALSYKRILEAGYITQEQLAQRLGKTQSTIANKLRLLSLDKEVQAALLKNEISERHARALLVLTDKDMQKELLKKIVDGKLTVRKTEEEIRKMEKEMYDKKNSGQTIEIIDFDDNPFKDPTPDFKPAKNDSDVSMFDEMIQEVPIQKGEPKVKENQEVKEVKEKENPKPKSNIPNLGIIDDTKDNVNKNIISSNHGFDNNFISDEEEEVVTLNEIEPDKIDFVENIDSNPPAFDELIEKVAEESNDFDKIKAIIEKCQSEINALGYKTTYEKFDLDTMYQIIFKINKN